MPRTLKDPKSIFAMILGIFGIAVIFGDTLFVKDNPDIIILGSVLSVYLVSNIWLLWTLYFKKYPEPVNEPENQEVPGS
jgi:hypothetical protein